MGHSWGKFCMKFSMMWNTPTPAPAGGSFLCSYYVVSEVQFMCFGVLIVTCFFSIEIDGSFNKGLISSRLTKNGTGKQLALDLFLLFFLTKKKIEYQAENGFMHIFYI